MSVRDDVLTFLRDPDRFIGGCADAATWIDGLERFALPSIEAHDDRRLREAQERAWRGLADQRAGLILGPPGTGKTHILSWLIAGFRESRRRAGLPARVLVTAFTRNAIGNVVDAVAARQQLHLPSAPTPLYFGEPPAAGVAPGVGVLDRRGGDALVARLAAGDCTVGMTVWSLYWLLTNKQLPGGDAQSAPLFDLICIDEASQLVLGHGLMALAALAPAGRVVVAGDDQQLPPIRAGRPVLLDGRELGGSLYAFLKSVGAPEFALDETFRLNAPLTVFPERSFYPGRYVSRSTRQLALRPGWEDGLDLLARTALNPDLPLVVLLHDGPTAATMNPFEVRVATTLAEALASRFEDNANGVPADLWSRRLAIVSPHRAQNAAIRSALPAALRAGAFVETVDRVQGKEREAIILSYCVADAEFALTEGEFIFSPERLNVAATRAESKLVVIVNRRLLEAVPSDQELLDKAELLREFVFSCDAVATTTVTDSSGRQVAVEIRARGFSDRETVLDLTPDATTAAPVADAMTDQARGVLEAVRRIANESQYGNAPLKKVQQAMALTSEPIAEAALLHRLGWISLQQRTGNYGAFFTASPFAAPRVVWAIYEATVRMRIDLAIREARGGRHAFYERVRDRFAWADDQGRDQLMPVLQLLEDEGVLEFGSVANGITIAMRRSTASQPASDSPPLPELTDADFLLLNRLEDMEAKRINFGVFDAWVSSVELSVAIRWSPDEVASSLARLQAQGHLMLAEEGRVRSRMGELARELKHVKQRFHHDDAAQRPYLVRSLKIELRDRAKPERRTGVADAIAVAERHATASQRVVLDGLGRMLLRDWGENAVLAAFQADGLARIIASWNAVDSDAIAIAADTGSGKTEAAVLPLIVAAMADRMDGVEGTRAILAYPRVRLATNQAQRLAGYLAELVRDETLPAITLGLQVADVPQSFYPVGERWADSWRPAGPNALTFPFFGCPTCGADLVLKPGEGSESADLLRCTACEWRFAGWVGSKQGLRERPPSLFLPTTDSLHQWMHNPDYGRLFGDDAQYAPPRAVLADEIHLYTHVHGAQVGLTLRRLAARVRSARSDAPPMLAIGMSATIGDPARAWGRLIGREHVSVIRPGPGDSTLNPRGREYFYFIQPEVESRGADIAGASTTIQALMCLGHGVRRRTGRDGGFRSLVFFDSIDKMRRLHSAFVDAEEGRDLAAFRTTVYGDDATGVPQTACCGEPVGCDRYADGECWHFAATDDRQCGARGHLAIGEPLRVGPMPIYSGTGGNAEKMVKDSDVVFATSSLEVGYDDPDITLVYQHYAPLNLASFIQRKGRGGRGADDRPTTAVTLSIYSPRDSWWFRRPQDMVSPTGFETPINPDNAYVRRAQALSALLDGLGRRQRRANAAFSLSTLASGSALAEAGALVEASLGPDIWRELDVAGAGELWSRSTDRIDLSACRSIPEVRQALDWAPDLLFETINLPTLSVTGPEVIGGGREDIALALATFAPGNATRRYNGQAVHWTRPVPGRAPWLSQDDYARAERQSLRPTQAALLAELPLAVRDTLADIEINLCRPRQVTVERLGRLAGTQWFGNVSYERARNPQLGTAQGRAITVRHDSRGELSGFLLVDTDTAASAPLDPPPAQLQGVDLFRAGVTRDRDSGLRVARVYWGADAELRFDDRQTEPQTYSQTFTHPRTGNPLLHGYQVTTEGVRLRLDSHRLDEVVAATIEAMTGDEGERRWRSAQFTRYLMESRARSVGINAYEAKRGADLLVAAAGDQELRADLLRLKRYWAPAAVADLLECARVKVLAQHPLMTQARVARTAAEIGSDAFRALFVQSLNDVGNEAALRDYLRSALIHSLTLRAKIWAAFVGAGDEGRMFAHARLAIQFGADADDVITIAEAGSHGDGTIRALAEQWPRALDLWSSGFLHHCPNAAEDALRRCFWTQRADHERWRGLDRRDPRVLAAIAGDLGAPAGSTLPASLINILFGVETVGAATFALYDVAADLESVRERLAITMRREPTDWELASAAVRDADEGGAPDLSRLKGAYSSLGESVEESFSPEARLADQAFRLGAPLCHDGCRACVHQSSDLMGDSLVQASTSRRLLSRYFD